MDFKIITIDGPSGVGKSTIASLLADKLFFFYVDTGAMFRCLALNWDKLGCPESEASLKKLGDETNIVFENGNVFCDGDDVTNYIRKEHISKLASKISCFSPIREVMKKQQREMVEKIRNSFKYKGAVLEGRDIGTVVFPDAEYKFFLDAHPEVRAKRRMLQVQELGEDVSYKKILETLLKRDHRDKNRNLAPLIPAKDSIIVNSENMTISQVLEKLISRVVE